VWKLDISEQRLRQGIPAVSLRPDDDLPTGSLDGGFVFVFAEPMDGGNEKSLMTIGDTENGWKTLCRLVFVDQKGGEQGISGGERRSKLKRPDALGMRTVLPLFRFQFRAQYACTLNVSEQV
jgi:hypothetical protein